MAPLFLLMGWHIACLAFLVRKYLRFPYLFTMVCLYGLLLVPLWLPSQNFPFVGSLAATILVLLAVVGPVAVRGRTEMMDGGNVETAAPAHMILVMSYLLFPAVRAAIASRGG